MKTLCFWNIVQCCFAYFVTVRQYIANMVILVYALYFCVDLMSLVRVHVIWVHLAKKSHGISAFWSCDRIGKLNATYL